jgi:hypothetical protein
MDQSDQIRDTYAHFGLALYMAQVLEHGLVNAMVIARLANGERLSPTDVDSFMDQKFELTLGRLIRDLRVHIPVQDSLAQLLAGALKKRNWLAHAYFRDHSLDFMTDAGRAAMITELQEAKDYFKTADRSLDAAVRPLRDRIGFSDDRIEAESQRALSELQAGS